MQRRHVIVVGGGVIGCATAYRLARAGLAISLVERDGIAAHASAWNAGNLNPLYETRDALLPVALEAFRLHGELQDELSHLQDAALRAVPVARIILGEDAADRARLEVTAALYERTAGFSARWLDRHALRSLEPRIAQDIEFGLLTHGSLAVDGEAFTRGLARAAGAFGAGVLQATPCGVITSGDRVTALRTAAGAISCDAIVFATGPWVGDLHEWLGVELPVEPVKGELLLVRLPGEAIKSGWGAPGNTRVSMPFRPRPADVFCSIWPPRSCPTSPMRR
jgi:glycine/D-amino acid oxidase-like deaminating enzyme